MNGETCEKLSVFCSAIFGLASAGTLAVGTGALGATAAFLSVPAIIAAFRKSPNSPTQIVASLQRSIEANWRGWASRSGELSKNQIEVAIAALDAVLDLLQPEPRQLMQAGRDNAVLVKLVVDEARSRAPDDYGNSHDLVQCDINARFLADVLTGALARLDGEPDFEAALTPWFQREVLANLDVIRQTIEDLPVVIAAQIRDSEALIAELERIRAAFGQSQTLIANFLRLMIGEEIPPDQFAATLYANMERWKSAGQQLGVLDRSANLTPKLAELKRRAEAARAAERIDEFWQLMGSIEDLQRKDIERLDRHAREVKNESDLRRADLLATKAIKRDTAIATFRLKEAAEEIAGIIDVEVIEPVARFEALVRAQKDWYERGRDKGLNSDSSLAVELARVCVSRAVGTVQRGGAQDHLGTALATLGAREGGMARLGEAVAAFRSALEERTRERVPLDWAMTQNNLGNALQMLGARENGTARLEEAVAAFRSALEERTRERVPLEWAMTQNNLGNALLTLGSREHGTARLKEAVAAFGAALEERTRDRVPLAWAMTQNNLGTALRALGQRERGTARLKKAVAAFRAALEERTRERVPLDWAAIQNNLGNALRVLGQRESVTARLEEAVAAFRSALEERTRERVPLDWATTHNNLGNALRALGQRESVTARLEEAVAAYRLALEEFTPEKHPHGHGLAEQNLAMTLAEIARRRSA